MNTNTEAGMGYGFFGFVCAFLPCSTHTQNSLFQPSHPHCTIAKTTPITRPLTHKSTHSLITYLELKLPRYSQIY